MTNPRHDLLTCAALSLCLSLGGAGCGSNSPTADGGDTTVTPDDDTTTTQPDLPPEGPVMVGGDRPAEVHVPAGYDHATATPLLLVLHGYTASGAFMNGYLSLQKHANERGFLYLTPDGTVDASGAPFWNASDACCDFAHTGVDDSAYLRQIIEETRAVFNVDATRIFVVGHSNGGFMAYRMACDHADLIAAVASVAGAMPESACAPSEPLAALQIHGTADETVLYEGGEFAGVPYPGAEATTAAFAQAVGCSDATEPTVTSLDLDASVAGAETSGARHAGCGAGAAAELWTVAGGGHVPSISDSFMSATLDYLFEHPKP